MFLFIQTFFPESYEALSILYMISFIVRAKFLHLGFFLMGRDSRTWFSSLNVRTHSNVTLRSLRSFPTIQYGLVVVVCVSEGSPFSWWLGGPGSGRLQTYWGGAQPGSQQCACGLRGDCVDPQHYCNCDADRSEW